MAKRYTYSEVTQVLLDKNIELISKEYVSWHDKLDCKCIKCGRLFSLSFSRLKKSKNGCRGCANKLKYTYDYVKQFLLERNINLISKEYRSNTHQILKCECILCGENFNNTFGNIKNQNNGCPVCSMKKQRQTCIKKYGFECCLCNNDIKNKIKQTMLNRYGVDHPSRSRDILLKILKSGNRRGEISYWKTGEMVPWCGGFEKAVIEYFNENQIEFKWQIPFILPGGRKYFCDFYLVKEDKYIEVKGRFYEAGLRKWTWFHKEHPNSELWDQKKLRADKIIDRRKTL